MQQADMIVGQSMGQYVMMDLANHVLGQCWDICYDRQLNRQELADCAVPDAKTEKMDACARKCVARHFEVQKLMMRSRELREKEMMEGLPPGSLSVE